MVLQPYSSPAIISSLKRPLRESGSLNLRYPRLTSYSHPLSKDPFHRSDHPKAKTKTKTSFIGQVTSDHPKTKTKTKTKSKDKDKDKDIFYRSSHLRSPQGSCPPTWRSVRQHHPPSSSRATFQIKKTTYISAKVG